MDSNWLVAALRDVLKFLGVVIKALRDRVFPIVWKIAKVVLTLMGGTALAIWGTLVPEVDVMAEAVKYRFMDDFPITLKIFVERIAWPVAFLIVLASWILLSYATVWICKFLWTVLYRGVLK